MTKSIKTNWLVTILVLSAIALLCALVSLTVGASSIPLSKIVNALIAGEGSTYTILTRIRLPRIILGFSVGSSLSLAGVLLQGVFCNPLVEPYTLGISGGASLGICLAIILKLTALFGVAAFPLLGFAGALLTIFLVYMLNSGRGKQQTQSMLLTGVMISFISSSIVMLLISLSTTEDLKNIIFWIMGSLDESNNLLIAISCIAAISGLIISYLFCLQLNALSLGEAEAFNLGINTETTAKILFVIASLLSGLSVAVSGIIGFVGLVVPHIMRMITGNDHRILLLSSFLGGGIFLVACDTLARTIIAPLELPVGVITGIIGGSIFIWAMNRKGVQQ